MKNIEIFKNAQTLISNAQNDEKFFLNNADNLRGTGENSVDYSIYEFDLSEDYSLLIDFIDFSFNGFSIINKSHIGVLSVLNPIED